MKSEDVAKDAVQILDAIPSAVFIVDGEVAVHGLNRAARSYLDVEVEEALNQRCGELLGCANPRNLPGRCGETERCSGCVLRNSLEVIDGGQDVVRARHEMELMRGAQCEPVTLWVSTSAVEVGGQRRALVVLEDITELVRLKELVPICASCKKVRTGDDYWEMVESYISKYLDLSFTHGICPECAEKLYKDLG